MTNELFRGIKDKMTLILKKAYTIPSHIYKALEAVLVKLLVQSIYV